MSPSRWMLRAEVHWGDRRLLTHTLELSADSVSLACTGLPVGERVRVVLSMPGLVPEFEVGAQVADVQGDDGYGRPSSAQCRIDSLSEPARRALARLATLPSDAGPCQRAVPPTYRCLLVEDNEFIRDLLAHGFERYGLTRNTEICLEVAADAERAIELIQAEPWDLAIIDHFLPTRTGAELIASIRANPRSTSMLIVAISIGGVEARDASMAAGADLFLHKPVVLRDLFSTLDRLWAGAAAPS